MSQNKPLWPRVWSKALIDHIFPKQHHPVNEVLETSIMAQAANLGWDEYRARFGWPQDVVDIKIPIVTKVRSATSLSIEEATALEIDRLPEEVAERLALAMVDDIKKLLVAGSDCVQLSENKSEVSVSASISLERDLLHERTKK